MGNKDRLSLLSIFSSKKLHPKSFDQNSHEDFGRYRHEWVNGAIYQNMQSEMGTKAEHDRRIAVTSITCIQNKSINGF